MGDVTWQGALAAPGPAPHLAGSLDLFGRFVGSWDLVVRDLGPDGAPVAEEPGEWHFGWVLGGRAVQDVWIVPSGPGVADDRRGTVEYGTGVRVYDPASATWTVSWSGAVKQRFHRFTAAAEGDDVVLRGVEGEPGPRLRWTFHDIEPDRFGWRNERSDDGGATWTTVQTMVVTRR